MYKFIAIVMMGALGLASEAMHQPGTPAAPPGTKPQPPHVQPPAPRPSQQPTPTPVPNQPGSLQNPRDPQNPGTPQNPQQPADPNQPQQPGQGDPAQPLDPVLPAFPDPTDPNLTPEQRLMIQRLRAQQPFTFQSPQAEARFNDSARRLMRLEQRLEKANQDQLRRLGEIRTLSGDRQNAALLDLVQQLLSSQRDLQRYMVAARVNLTGEFDLPPETANNPGTTSQNGAQPAQNPGIPPQR